jgi:multiple sugar transport system substrate-binding protein
MVRVNGKVYGLTLTTNTNFIAYNKSIFREAGLDPNTPPRTTDELDRAARATTKYDSAGRFVRLGYKPASLSLWAYAFGGKWYDPQTGQVTANDPANIAAARWMASYRKDFDMNRVQAFQSTFGSDNTANGPFFIGKLAMWQTGEWSEEFIHRYAPNLDWGWFALPAPPGGRVDTTNAGGSVFVIPAACKHKKEAWTFLNWITSPKQVAEFCWSIKNVPPLIESGRDPRFQNDPLFKFAIRIQQGPNAFGAPAIPIWPTYRREIDRVEEAVVLGGADPKQELDRLQANMSRELKRTMEDLGR